MSALERLPAALSAARRRLLAHRGGDAGPPAPPAPIVRRPPLVAEVRPHFLFNALHTVSTLMYEDVPAAHTLLVLLSELLRRALEDGAGEVPLRRELEVVELYREIEAIRFGDRLMIEVQVDAAARDALLPPMLLHPLLESAVRHTVEWRREAGGIGVRARVEGDSLVVEVEDDGRTPSEHPVRRDDPALAGVRTRLRARYGEAERCTLADRPGGGARARVLLPLRPDPAAAR